MCCIYLCFILLLLDHNTEILHASTVLLLKRRSDIAKQCKNSFSFRLGIASRGSHCELHRKEYLIRRTRSNLPCISMVDSEYRRELADQGKARLLVKHKSIIFVYSFNCA